jgi:hypothetical protein
MADPVSGHAQRDQARLFAHRLVGQPPAPLQPGEAVRDGDTSGLEADSQAVIDRPVAARGPK